MDSFPLQLKLAEAYPIISNEDTENAVDLLRTLLRKESEETFRIVTSRFWDHLGWQNQTNFMLLYDGLNLTSNQMEAYQNMLNISFCQITRPTKNEQEITVVNFWDRLKECAVKLPKLGQFVKYLNANLQNGNTLMMYPCIYKLRTSLQSDPLANWFYRFLVELKAKYGSRQSMTWFSIYTASGGITMLADDTWWVRNISNSISSYEDYKLIADLVDEHCTH